MRHTIAKTQKQNNVGQETQWSRKAIELALDLGGNQTLAVKEIEKMKKGLSKNSAVASALRTANEEMTGTSSVAMPDGIPLGKVKKRKELEESRDKNCDTENWRYKPGIENR